MSSARAQLPASVQKPSVKGNSLTLPFLPRLLAADYVLRQTRLEASPSTALPDTRTGGDWCWCTGEAMPHS